MPETSIISLDLATRVGWARWHRRVTSFGTKQLPKAGELGGRYLDCFDRWFLDQLAEVAPALVIFDPPWVGPKTSQDVARCLIGLASVVELRCYQQEIACREAHNQTVLKHWTGKGGGIRKDKKARTIAACNVRGFHPRNDDEADALAILDYAAHCLGVKTDNPEGPLFGVRQQGEAA